MTIGMVVIFIYAAIIFHAVVTAVESRRGGDFRGGFQRLNVAIAMFSVLIIYRLIAIEFFGVILESSPALRVGSAAFLLVVVLANHFIVYKARKRFKETDEHKRGHDTAVY